MADEPASTADAAEVRERLDALESAVGDLTEELDEKVLDVRERVIQVKREADAKAPADHDHPDLADEVDQLEALLDALGRDFADLDAATDDLDERVEAVGDRMEAGFSNFEEVLEYLLDTTDRLDERIGTLARAVVDLRSQVDRLAASAAERDAADRLRASAHEHGVTKADCESCGGTVHLAMLTAPECPHCAAGFTEVEPRTGFFRSSVLHTGTHPALEAPVDEESPDLDALVQETGTEAPPVDSPPSGGASTPEGESTEPVEEDGPATPAGSPGNEAADRPLDAVSGVGPAYAERLRDAGVETVGDLALADPERLAREADIAQGRVRTLVDRARDLHEFDPAGE